MIFFPLNRTVWPGWSKVIAPGLTGAIAAGGLLWGAIALPARAESPDPVPTSPPGEIGPIDRAFAAASYPLKLRLSDLDDRWKTFTLTSQFEASVALSLTSNIFGVGASVYYSKGEQITLGNQSFVLAYRLLPGSPKSLNDVLPSLEIYPSLLNLSLVGSINDLQSFNLPTELDRLKVRFNTPSGFPFPFPGGGSPGGFPR